MINIAICDDEMIFATGIENIVNSICQKENLNVDIDVFNSGTDLKSEIASGIKYDLIFLDIYMKDENGIMVARHIRKTDENAIIVFVSRHDECMIKLFRLGVFAFIKKPIQINILKKVFLETISKILSQNAYFIFKFKCQEFKVLYKEIMYFESKGRKINVHIRNGDINIFNGKLNEIEKELQNGKNQFLRIHQSYLVNFYHIRERTKKEVTLTDGNKLPISEERKKNLNKKYNLFLNREV